MALIIKEGNQISKIFSPEMDVSRSSLLSISNDINEFRSVSRMVYRYDNKLEDYDIHWIEYDALGQVVNMFYQIPPDHVSEFYLRNYVKKSYRYDVDRNITSVMYHELDYLLISLPEGLTYVNGELVNSTPNVINLYEGAFYDLNPSVTNMEPFPADIVVTVTAYLNIRLDNVSLTNDITIPAGTYNVGTSGYIVLSTDLVIPLGQYSAILPYIQHDIYVVPIGGVPIPANGSFIPHPADIKASGMSSRKALHLLGYDTNNRMISSIYRNTYENAVITDYVSPVAGIAVVDGGAAIDTINATLDGGTAPA